MLIFLFLLYYQLVINIYLVTFYRENTYFKDIYVLILWITFISFPTTARILN